MEDLILMYIDQNIVWIALALCFGGIVLWGRTDRKFEEKQKGEAMFNEVNSKQYDDDNIQ